MRSIAPLSLALCVPGIASCLGGEPRGASSGSDALIYGDDDRIEAYEPVEPDVAWLFASEAAVFWEPDGLLVPSGDGYAIATSPTFGESNRRCARRSRTRINLSRQRAARFSWAPT